MPSIRPAPPALSSIRVAVAALRAFLLIGAGLLTAAVAPGDAAGQSGNCFGGPCIEITPRDSVFDRRPPAAADTVVKVRVTFCSDKEINWKSRRIEHNGVDVTGQFSLSSNGYAQCRFGGIANGTIVLTRANEGLHTVMARAETVDGYLGSRMVRYRYLWDGYVAPSYVYAVSPAHHTRFPGAHAADTAVFTVTNLGNRTDTATATATCTVGAGTCTVVGAGSGGRITLDTAAANRTQTLRIAYVTGNAGDSASVTLRVTSNSYSSVTDAARTDVFVPAEPVVRPPGVVVAATSHVLARQLCLTASAGSAAASECGDLRLVHPLPGVRTYNTTRAPTLIYSSQHAVPHPIVPLEVTLESWLALPATVDATVRDQAGAIVGSGSWSGSDWGVPGTTRRLAVPLTLSATGIHPLSIEVRRTSSGVSQVVGSATLHLPVVNRSQSALGSGWWVAGVERLDVGSMMWIGGDGSVRKYHATGQPGVWVADPIDRADTIVLEQGYYIRRLPNNLRIRFDGAGNHVETENRLGHITRFYYATVAGRHGLDRVVVPSPSGGLTYRFVRDPGTGHVLHVESPGPAGTPRVTALGIDGSGRLTSITDPALPPVAFGYADAAPLVTSRTDRVGQPTSFTLDRARLVRAQQTIEAGVVLGTSFRPAELVGLAAGPGSAKPLEQAYARIDGPRSDVDDITRVWVNALGAPFMIRNPHGRDTRVAFGDARWPGLATDVISVSGLISRVHYNGRGLVDSSVAINPLGDGRSAITRYHWNPTWTQPDSVVGPNGVVTSYGYDARGNVSHVQPGRDAARRVTVEYHPSGAGAGLYHRSTVPGFIELDHVGYDPILGNSNRMVDRLGNETLTAGDAIGRVREARVPIGPGRVRVDSTYYDAAGRVERTVTYGPPQTFQSPAFNVPRTIAAESLYVRMTYDDESRPWSVTRWGTTTVPGVSEPVATFYTYDLAGRKTVEREGSRRQTFAYDPAGNVTEHNVGLGTVRMEYDALGRLVRRIQPPVFSGTESCFTLFWPNYSTCNPNFTVPFRPNRANGIEIPGDTAVFVYDVAGNMLRADNRHARIRRSYTPSGLLLTDTLRIRTVRYDTEQYGSDPDGFQTHAYVLKHAYDLTGRRESLTYPTQLCHSCTVSYHHDDASTGALDRVVDLAGQEVRFRYHAAGMLERVEYPAGVLERLTYDAEGRAYRRDVRLAGGGYVINDSISYDPLGRVTSGRTWAARASRYRNVWNYYTGVGALAHMEQAFSDGRDPKREEFITDQIGNRARAIQENMVSGYSMNPGRQQSRYDFEGRLVETWSVDHAWQPHPEYDAATMYRHDMGGYLRYQGRREIEVREYGTSKFLYDAHYYQADGRLRSFQRGMRVAWYETPPNRPPFAERPVTEEYRYDALGRRVLVRALRDCYWEGCESTVQRFIWDGDQLVYETRGPGSDTLSASRLENESPSGFGDFGQPEAYGRVGYTHAGGIDRPLAVHRMTHVQTFYPHTNWRGLYDGATNTAGEKIPCAGISMPCSNSPDIDWPGSVTSAFIGSTYAPREQQPVWAGSLVTEMADASGLLYRRNRYYDPASGRFTQQDPIGLAGGLNLYGFAGGDPVNYSDPTGLCPYGPKSRDNNVDDCPEDEIGAALRWLKEHGGRVGERTINAIRDKEINPVLVDAETMDFVSHQWRDPSGGLPNGFRSTGHPQMIVILSGRTSVETAFTVTHEVGHVTGGTYGGWRASQDLWKELPPSMRPANPTINYLLRLESDTTTWKAAVRALEQVRRQ